MSILYMKEFIILTRAHIGLVVLPSFWLGSLFAMVVGYKFDLSIFLLGFLIIFLTYASASYINDYYDYEADKHNRQIGFSGGSGVLQKHPQLKESTRSLAKGYILISVILTIYLSWTTYIPLWSIAYIATGAFFAYYYSAPPFRLCYRGIGELPHFIAGLMNAGWGYLIIAGTIDMNILIFAIPFSLHLLTVILLFEIPDKEADISVGKQNFIVKYGREKGYILIAIIFWTASIYFILLATTNWYADHINFWIPSIASMIPSFIATYISIKRPREQTQATSYAIKGAISLFAFSFFVLIYFLYLQL